VISEGNGADKLTAIFYFSGMLKDNV